MGYHEISLQWMEMGKGSVGRQCGCVRITPERMKEVGMFTPIAVRPFPEKYKLLVTSKLSDRNNDRGSTPSQCLCYLAESTQIPFRTSYTQAMPSLDSSQTKYPDFLYSRTATLPRSHLPNADFPKVMSLPCYRW